MIVDPRSIPDGGITVEGEEDPAIIDIDDPLAVFPLPIRYRLRLNRVGRMLLVRGRLGTTGRFTCARCLKEFSGPVRVDDFGREVEIASEEGKIDLTPDIREDTILAIPAKPLCRADCRGICLICGRDLNRGDCGCTAPADDSPFAKLTRLTVKKPKG